MTDTLTLVWQGETFQSSTNTTTNSYYHITGTNMTVDWGDGTTGTIITNKSFKHSYSSSGTYTITITGDSITKLGIGTFYECSGLKSITIPSSVTSLDSSCFRNCTSLTGITIPSNVTSLGNGCFMGCTGLTSITIPSSVTSLGNNCFQGCTGLISVTVPSSVTSLGSSCFYGCTGLINIIFTNPTPPIITDANAWTNLPTSCKIYIPEGNLSTYTSASNYPSSSTYTYIERDMIEMEKAEIVAREIFNKLHPVGSIYMTTSSENPTNLFGGAWEQVKDKFLLACGDSYANLATGGEETHTLVTGELPSHTHNYNGGFFWTWGDTSAKESLRGSVQGGYWGNNALSTKRGGIVNSGGGQAHNNMPPYTVVYIWRRIA